MTLNSYKANPDAVIPVILEQTLFNCLFLLDHRPEEFYTNFGVLPNTDTCKRIKDEFVFLVAKSIVSYLPAFKPLKTHISRHIDHPFVKEMSQKSIVIPLGLIFENENTSSGIAKILRELQEKYVPIIVKDGEKHVWHIFVLCL